MLGLLHDANKVLVHGNTKLLHVPMMALHCMRWNQADGYAKSPPVHLLLLVVVQILACVCNCGEIGLAKDRCYCTHGVNLLW